MTKTLWSSIRLSLAFMLLCGLAYNFAITGIAQAVLPKQANGSLLYDREGHVIGSELIGQNVTDPKLFQGRISSIAYRAEGSGSPNYAPSSEALLTRMRKTIAQWKDVNPEVPVSGLPADLITNSGSGLDPHISPAAAEAQIPRISKLTGVSKQELLRLVAEHTSGRELGFLGEPVVNVLELNLALSQRIN